MANERDICERLEDPNYDGAVFLRLDAAKEITALRYYVARLEGDLASEEYQHARTKIQLENAQEHILDQALDIATLGQEVGRLREALEKIAALDVPRRVVDRYRVDGEPSKYDRCAHVINMWDDCEHCISDYARAALAEKEEK